MPPTQKLARTVVAVLAIAVARRAAQRQSFGTQAIGLELSHTEALATANGCCQPRARLRASSSFGGCGRLVRTFDELIEWRIFWLFV